MGSLQLLLAVKTGGTRSFPQIFFPARRGFLRKNSFRSAKYQSIAAMHSGTPAKSLLWIMALAMPLYTDSMFKRTGRSGEFKLQVRQLASERKYWSLIYVTGCLIFIDMFRS